MIYIFQKYFTIINYLHPHPNTKLVQKNWSFEKKLFITTLRSGLQLSVECKRVNVCYGGPKNAL